MAQDSVRDNVTSFFDRLRGKERIKISDKGLSILQTPLTAQDRITNQKIQTLTQFVRNKNWTRKHIEYFDEYRRMVSTFPIIKAAVDIYAEETNMSDSGGNVITIKSENIKVKEALEECFFKNLKINSKGYLISREICKFGNVFGYLTTRKKDGVTDVVFLPPESILREQMFDATDLENYRFSWYGMGGGVTFEPWELVHWKNSEDIEMEPYGVSILRPIIETWRRVVLIREALVIYRISRAPSKLLYKIGTDGMTGEEAFRFAQDMKKEIQKKPLVNPQTGEIDFKYNPMPLSINTFIPLLDGRTITLGELVKEYEEGKINYVYSIQDKTKQIVAGKVQWCGKNYTAEKLIRVWLDNESYVDSAPEHPFILRDGTIKRADELIEKDALMPFYSKKELIRKDCNLEYEQIYNPATEKYEFTHRLIALENEKDLNETVVHHKNFNRFDNTPENLQWMNFYEHRELHSNILTQRWLGPSGEINKAKQSELMKSYYVNMTSEEKQKFSKQITEKNIKRKSYLALAPYINSEKHKKYARENIKETLRKRTSLTSNWKKNMQINFSETIWLELNKQIINDDKFGHIKATKFINEILINEIKTINVRKSLRKGISGNILRKELRKKGFNSFEEYKNELLRESKYINHKVIRIEILENQNTDVACMTVVGLNGEDDRHNFAYCGTNIDGSINHSGSFVKNSISEDIFMPVYEGSPSDVQVLEGAGNLDQIEDYKIIKDDIFAGLKIPKAYLTFEENLNSKSTLGNEDIRFAKTIQRHQQNLVDGFVHIGIVHLHLLGFSEEDMESFTIEMNNPSVASEKAKLELVQARIDIAKGAWDPNNAGLNLMSYSEVLSSILKFSDDEIKTIIKNQFIEKKIAWRLTEITTNGTYEEPAPEKELAKLKKLGATKGSVSSFDGLHFESTSISSILKDKVDEELEILFPTVKAKPTKSQIHLFQKGSLTENLKQSKKDLN